MLSAATRTEGVRHAPGPLGDYTAQFDPLLGRLAQRRGLRAYPQGLLLPRGRNKTMTTLAGAEPVAQHAAVQGLQWSVRQRRMCRRG